MKNLTVELGQRSYPIRIGPDLLADPTVWEKALGSRRCVIVSNETVAPLYLDSITEAVGSPIDCIRLPDGEEHKTISTVESIVDRMLELRLGRDAIVIALGGGVVGDIAGFAASVYQRGIDFVQVPTTLLAQVDSSVGGKTGVNHPRGKNMIGAFHQPLLVVADTNTLSTLPARELRAGVAEVIKYGLLGDPDLIAWLEYNMADLLALDSAALSFAIHRSCENKARIVAADERESGQRALLNFGHTFGHAVETILGYGTWLHGEAVAIGMCMACDMSVRLGWLDAADSERAIRLIGSAGLPTSLPAGFETERMIEVMGHDKKALAGRIRLILLNGLGDAVITGEYDDSALHETIAHFANRSAG